MFHRQLTNWRSIPGMAMVSIAFAAAHAGEVAGDAAATPAPAKAKAAHHAKKATASHKRTESAKKVELPGNLVLKLALTLTPPKGPPHVAPVPQPPLAPAGGVSAEAQKEAAAKDKELQALNAQIAELERTIKARQNQLDSLPASSVAAVPPAPAVSPATVAPAAAVPAASVPASQPAGEMPAAAGVSGMANGPAAVQPKSETRVPVAKAAKIEKPGLVELIEENLNLAAGLVVVLLAIFGLVRYRGRKTGAGQKRGRPLNAAGMKHGPPSSQVNTITPPLVKPHQSATQPEIKVPAKSAEPKPQTILPPEYEMLEEADIYLRFGHDKLAEEALREAIKINPRNPQAYLTLLRIHFSREDRAAFLAIAQQLKSLGDESVWPRVVEMGRSLDPDNAFYN